MWHTHALLSSLRDPRVSGCLRRGALLCYLLSWYLRVCVCVCLCVYGCVCVPRTCLFLLHSSCLPVCCSLDNGTCRVLHYEPHSREVRVVDSFSASSLGKEEERGREASSSSSSSCSPTSVHAEVCTCFSFRCCEGLSLSPALSSFLPPSSFLVKKKLFSLFFDFPTRRTPCCAFLLRMRISSWCPLLCSRTRWSCGIFPPERSLIPMLCRCLLFFSPLLPVSLSLRPLKSFSPRQSDATGGSIHQCPHHPNLHGCLSPWPPLCRGHLGWVARHSLPLSVCVCVFTLCHCHLNARVAFPPDGLLRLVDYEAGTFQVLSPFPHNPPPSLLLFSLLPCFIFLFVALSPAGL